MLETNSNRREGASVTSAHSQSLLLLDHVSASLEQTMCLYPMVPIGSCDKQLKVTSLCSHLDCGFSSLTQIMHRPLASTLRPDAKSLKEIERVLIPG